MQRSLYHATTVHGAPAVLADTLRRQVRSLLRTVTDEELAEQTPEGDLLLYLPTHALGKDRYKLIRLHTGVAEQHDNRTCIPLRWTAEPGRFVFPRFDGTLELEPLSDTSATLALVGTATLPLGPVGAALDSTMLGGVLDRALQDLIDRLAGALQLRAGHPTAQPRRVTAPAEQLTVREVMTPDPLLLHDQMPLKTAALLLLHYNIAGAPVHNDHGGLVGVLSETDLLAIEAPRDARGGGHRDVRTVGEACTRPAREIHPTAPVRETARLMRDYDVSRLIVVDGSQIVGIITRHDVLKAMMRGDVDTERVLRQVLSDEDASDVSAEVHWGVARLSGRVLTSDRLECLVDRVRRLDGVIAVDTEIDVEIAPVPSGSPGRQSSSDETPS